MIIARLRLGITWQDLEVNDISKVNIWGQARVRADIRIDGEIHPLVEIRDAKGTLVGFFHPDSVEWDAVADGIAQKAV